MTTQATRPSLERRILDHLNTAVMLFDAELRLKYLNPAAEVLFEVSARHLLGQAAASLLPCPDARVEDRLNAALASCHPFTEREINILISEGRTKTVNCTVLPLHHFDADKEVLVELYQVDRHLRIAREDNLLEQHQAARQLVRGLAHEIKNPLGGLRGAAQLLERELSNEDLKEYTRIIIGEADRLRGLVNRMLGPNQLPQDAPLQHPSDRRACAQSGDGRGSSGAGADPRLRPEHSRFPGRPGTAHPGRAQHRPQCGAGARWQGPGHSAHAYPAAVHHRP
jgi:two-component system, NtrC family, nitrogen regulation sensor histidine kinase GlnL